MTVAPSAETAVGSVRLAHFSDVHLTVSPLGQPPGLLLGKRAFGALNYYVGGRGRHFENVDHRLSKLLADIDEQSVDHALCTGDVTQMSYEIEFKRCAAVFGDRLSQPDQYTVIPGNHDRYTEGALRERRFESFFGRVASPTGEFPFAKQIAGGVTLVGLDVSRPRIIDSTGLVGEQQLARLREILTDRVMEDRFVVLCLHYALFREGKRSPRPGHGIQDRGALLEVIESKDVHLDLVLHGHIHRSFEVSLDRCPVVCPGSATDLHVPCGYNIYEIDLSKRTFSRQRRVWDPEADAYGHYD